MSTISPTVQVHMQESSESVSQEHDHLSSYAYQCKPDATPTTTTSPFDTSTIQLYEAKAPPPLNLPASSPSNDAEPTPADPQDRGLMCVSPSLSTPETSRPSSPVSSESTTRAKAAKAAGGFRHRRQLTSMYLCGERLPYAIEEEDEPDTSASCYSTESAPRLPDEKMDNTRTTRSYGAHSRGIKSSIKEKLAAGKAAKRRMKRMFVPWELTF